MHEHAKDIAEKIRKRRTETMSDTREIRQTCGMCDRITMANVVNKCGEFASSAISNNENEEIMNVVEDAGA